jgi:glycosyltransferase involved in cell wall biosynthesis
MNKTSVIIPTFNRATVLSRAIDSVLSQSHAADEIIVIDDGSTDNTEQFIKKSYPQIKLIKQTNKGVSAARNTGIKQATGDWLCLLDSDDSWQKNKLEKQIEAINKNPEYLICHTNETWYRNGTVLNQAKKHEKRGGYIYQHCLPLCAISPSSVIINKTIFDDVGLFDESLPACEDYDMWLRICCKYPVLFIDEALTNKFGGHDDQLSQQHWGMDRFRILALEKSIQSNELSNEDKEAAIEMLLNKIRIFLKGAEKYGKNEYCDQFELLSQQYA